MSNRDLADKLTVYVGNALRTEQAESNLASTHSKIDSLRAKIAAFTSNSKSLNNDITTKLEIEYIVNQMEHTQRRLDEIKADSEELRTRVANIEKNSRKKF